MGVALFRTRLGQQSPQGCQKGFAFGETAKFPISSRAKVFSIGVISLLLGLGTAGGAIAQTPTFIAPDASTPTCPTPALSQLTRYRIRSGDTLNSLAARHNLIPATLMGFNPNLRNGSAPVGTEIVIPPYNGIRVEVPAGSSLREIARRYNVRPDVLFEVNGCQTSPRVVFVPGVNWSPTPAPTATNSPIDRYPLPSDAPVLTRYGWQLNPASGRVVFQSGVNLEAAAGTPVYAAGAGTIAFVGNQAGYGNLVVINHSQGLQTRYAQLDRMNVRVGQTVQAGATIGTVGNPGANRQPYLTFEVRSNSNLGWVAQDPGNYLRQLRLPLRGAGTQSGSRR
ncbi:LysM peptidoglycan-binding domain-containing M23 family metallopeptidase [Leptolyngbya ohadii]|uniref:LysM peptidoglycan-binding domain-containing M23 family metallopeptidase n=1 Tax=Leptolyngbya ohadii TaxID=1962290 RepID=UPI0019D4639B|nr:M23 family metallopeptidase [Leptolyngbya ohadii]